ncbi:YdeI/OmpD-associated family protein [Sediminibacterium soli]|uniref:YdeI/OmpD-associated family protein n=1 Tax=Sediminibacterium soli TaxID=2698829 RepID=UPI001379E5CE|nr:YdeI/OmpD-associated family protein [Sediminibacterium soli]NCI45980.1 DUF1905 domain-containing protein [Sediminibacterium soli]
MVQFTAIIQQFEEQGEKTGWTYIELPPAIAGQLKPGTRQSFRVKGRLDKHRIEGVALLPMGGGRFIIPINAAMRKGIRKKKGAMLEAVLSVDTKPLAIPPEFLECLEDEPIAKAFFNELKLSHRNYYTKWLTGVKTETARTKRISQAITALSKKQDFGTMIRNMKKNRID